MPFQVMNGHILYLYHVNESSLTKTENAVNSKFSGESSDLPPLKNRIRRLVDKTFGKFHKLTNPDEFKTFTGVCEEGFSVACSVHRSQPSTEVGATVDPVTAGPSTGCAEDRSRCARCAVLRERLKRAIRTRKEMHEQHVNITRFLQTQLRKRQAVRVLNQKLKRKDETIGKLKRKDAGCEIDELRKKHSCEIKRVNRRCRTLEKKAEIASTSFDELTTEADVARAQWKDEMNEKDNVISYLEDANQSLQTRVEASEGDTASLIAAIFQSDSRTYSVPTRLMVYDLVIMNQVPTHNIPSVPSN